MTDPTAEIWTTIQACNQAWTRGYPEEVATFFHPDAIMVSPQGQTQCRDRAAIVRSFVEYAEHATTQSFREVDHDVQVVQDTAVVHYGFEIRYALEGKTHEQRGREVLTLVRQDSRWVIVWRMQLPF
ncbi:MAG: nuclear transport factor 2 family protein [Myxococcota bacterium]